MKYIATHLVLVYLVVMSAGLHAVSGRTLLSSSQRRLAQATQLSSIPQGCQGIQLAVTARPSLSQSLSSSWGADPTAHGTVVISNFNNISVAFNQVVVQVLNVAAVTPFYTYATCRNDSGAILESVPAATGPTTGGMLTCTYRVDLPQDILTSGATDGLSVQATATIQTSNTQCTSRTTQIDTTFWTRMRSSFQQSNSTDQTFTTQQGWHKRNSKSDSHSWFTSWGGRRLSQAGAAGAAQMQTGQLGYVPTGCQGLAVTTYARYDQQQPGIVSGTVVFDNPGTFDIPIASVNVTLGNNIPVEPLFTTATCPGAVVPANPQPYTMGELVCSFTFVLPTTGPVAAVPIWTSAQATATIAMSDAECSSPVAVVPPPQPWVYGH